MRLDVLAANGAVVRLGHEFLIRGTQASFDQHVARGRQYADQHACTVYVVNIVFTDGSLKKSVHLPSPNPKARSCHCSSFSCRFSSTALPCLVKLIFALVRAILIEFRPAFP